MRLEIGLGKKTYFNKRNPFKLIGTTVHPEFMPLEEISGKTKPDSCLREESRDLLLCVPGEGTEPRRNGF